MWENIYRPSVLEHGCSLYCLIILLLRTPRISIQNYFCKRESSLTLYDPCVRDRSISRPLPTQINSLCICKRKRLLSRYNLYVVTTL
jgi:hypothetical protein